MPLPLRHLFKPLIEASADDLAIINQPIDFYGLNYYMPTRVAAGSGDGNTPDGHAAAMEGLPFHLEGFPEHDTTGFGWPIAPHYLTRLLRDFGKRYRKVLPPVFITEGGASFPDQVANGRVDDTVRTNYLADHIFAALAALPDVDLRGYFIWTLMDNWEWAAGFEQRFGLVHVDFDTLERTPKASYHWLQQVLEARRRR